VTRDAVQEIVLATMRAANQLRDANDQLDVSPEARLFGRGSPLDSMGLVTLLLDIEEALRAAGLPVTLTTDRAMSQARSPFRSVPALVEYIVQVSGEEPCRPRDAS
jgi:acyl carrier protein